MRAAEGAFDHESADALHVSLRTIERVQQRFAEAPPEERLDRALYDRPRPGSDPKLDTHAEAFLVAIACSKPPQEREHWTMQLLADRLVEVGIVEAISDETVRRTMKKLGRQRELELLKKRAQAVAEGAVVHPGRRCSLRRPHGGRARPLRRAF